MTDRMLPPALAEVARVGFDYDDGEGVDFEPYDLFDTAEDTTAWLRLWTGNPEADGSAFRVFGKDGAGGLAAIWTVRPGLPPDGRPVVFLGSEGECGLVAGNLSDLLWVLADGFGPREAARYEDEERTARPHAAFTAIAERFATTPRRPAREIVLGARAEFPSFEEDLDALCR
ncbi:SMI1/KNR4 family protein [Streptomyces sp. NPDC003487]